jgi:hypothetical protein
MSQLPPDGPPVALDAFEVSRERIRPKWKANAAVLGPLWYLRRGYWRKGILLCLAMLVTASVPAGTFVLAVLSSIILPISIVTATRMGPGGSVVATGPEDQARAIQVLIVTIVVWVILWRSFRRLWRRSLAFLVLGFVGAAVHPLVAVALLWVAAGAFAHFDEFQVSTAAPPPIVPLAQ